MPVFEAKRFWDAEGRKKTRPVKTAQTVKVLIRLEILGFFNQLGSVVDTAAGSSGAVERVF